MAIAGQKARVRVSGPPAALADEPTTGDGTHTRYQITDPARRVLDRAAPATVKSSPDGTTFTTVPAADYEVDRLSGTVVFHAARPAGTQVHVTGSYRPLSVAGEAKEFTYTLQGASSEATRFGDGFMRRVQTNKDVSGSISEWTSLDSYFEPALTSGTPLLLEFHSDAAADPDLRVWAMVSKAEMKAAVDGVQETSVEWQGTADNDGRMISLG